MEGITGFNKRKAKGRAKNDTPKNLPLKIQKLSGTSNKCYVQILGTGMDTQDTIPSVLLFFDKHRFIFNAGEGLQRLCTEHTVRLSKIDHVFLSRVCSETAGGLPGLLLTLDGIGDGISVDIWGPSMKYLVDAMQSFIPNAAIAHTHSIDRATNADGASLPDEEPILVYQDMVVKISAVLLHPSFSEGSEIVNGHTFLSSPSSLDAQEKRNRFSEPLLPHSEMRNRKDGLVPKPGNISVIYVCELPEIKGKFDPVKAVAHGLKPGPKYGELQSGNRVISDCGNVTVDPTDVLGPSVPGPIILLVDCPTLSHLQELLSLQSFNSYYADSDHSVDGGVKYGSKKIVKSVSCIIHLSPSSVAMTVKYQNWMKKFGKAQHIMAGHDIKNIETPILIASATIATRLNYLCPQLFPAPGFLASNPLNNIRPESMTTNEGDVLKLSGISRAENLLKFQLRPHAGLGLDGSEIPSLFSPTKVVNELLTVIPEIVDASEQLRHLWNDSRDTQKNLFHSQENIIMTKEPWIDGSGPVSVKKLDKQGPDASRDETLFIDSIDVDEVNHESPLCSCLENITREDMEIVLLGTGSSQPSKYRNVSSIYINLFSKGGLLLDCGEGTLGQLKRRLGLMGADDAVKGLRCIWISHIHADHHSGLARILALRSRLLQGIPHEPLLVVGPMQLEGFLDAYQRLEDLDMQFLDCWHTTMGAHKSNGKSSLGSLVVTCIVSKMLKNLKRVLEEAGLEALISVPVVHCEEAFGLVLKAAERVNSVGKIIPGWKLAYSGDTRPCPELIAAACGATVLIHEATFEDDMLGEAITKKHSTTKEAIEVGVSAGVYRTILTHFSQRYPIIPVFDEIYMHQTCIGFDLMSINIADLSVLPKVMPYLMLLFNHVPKDDRESFGGKEGLTPRSIGGV